jgi:hypothetical protein
MNGMRLLPPAAFSNPVATRSRTRWTATCSVAVVDHSVALSARIYDQPGERLAFFAGEGAATLRSLRVRTRRETDATSTSIPQFANATPSVKE